jgi:hypothetical protein
VFAGGGGGGGGGVFVAVGVGVVEPTMTMKGITALKQRSEVSMSKTSTIPERANGTIKVILTLPLASVFPVPTVGSGGNLKMIFISEFALKPPPVTVTDAPTRPWVGDSVAVGAARPMSMLGGSTGPSG